MSTILLVIVINTTGFLVLGGLLHWFYYVARRDRVREWKHQPDRSPSAKRMWRKLPLVLVNAVIINGMVGLALHVNFVGLAGRGYWGLGEYGLIYLVLSFFGMCLWYHVALYYWHRAMHSPFLFKRIHYWHHQSRYPVWLDGLCEHPLEAFHGGLVLTAPLLLPINFFAYFLFLGVVGIHELLDHSGIDLNIPFLSKSLDHDNHHRNSRVSYGQLLPLLDWLHGTNRPRPRMSGRARETSE